MSGRALRRVIERVDLEILALALRDAQPRVIERVLRNVSSKNAAHIREEMERSGSEESERSVEARQMLMQTAYAMKNHGDITVRGSRRRRHPSRWVGRSKTGSPRSTPLRARPSTPFRSSSPWPHGRSGTDCFLSSRLSREVRTEFSPPAFGCWRIRRPGMRSR